MCGEGRGDSFEGREAAGVAKLGSYEAAVKRCVLTVIRFQAGMKEVRRRMNKGGATLNSASTNSPFATATCSSPKSPRSVRYRSLGIRIFLFVWLDVKEAPFVTRPRSFYDMFAVNSMKVEKDGGRTDSSASLSTSTS